MSRDRLRRNGVALGQSVAAGFALTIAACNQPRAGGSAQPAEVVEVDDPADMAEALAADPERLADVQEACRTNAPEASQALCGAAAEARRRRFQGGGVTYTPGRADPFPSRPQPSPAPPAQPN